MWSIYVVSEAKAFLNMSKFDICMSFIPLIDDYKNVSEIRDVLDMLPQMQIWNNKKRLVIAFQKPNKTEEILHILWSKYLFNVVVVYESEAFIRFSYDEKICNSPPRSVSLGNCDILTKMGSFEQKGLQNLHNCTITASTYSKPIFVIQSRSTVLTLDTSNIVGEQYFTGGLEVVMFEELSRRMNFTVQYRVRQPNDSFRLTVDLREGLSDLYFVGVPVVRAFSEDVDSTIGSHFTHIMWYLPAGEQLSDLESMVKPFQPMCWMLVVITILVSASIFYALLQPIDPLL